MRAIACELKNASARPAGSDTAPMRLHPERQDAAHRQAGWFEYTYRCHWESGMGGGSYIDRTTYTVSVESQSDADALRQAIDQCPYEPKPER